jgi:DNA-directed RNA polymerase specialized sigma24 family protein
MPEGSAFRNLMARVRARDEEAAKELLRLYEPAIRRAIRFRLANPRLRRLFDSMDICQSVFGSFFVRAALGQYELENAQQLLRLLINMSQKKLADQERRQGAARRDYRRVEALGLNEKNLPSKEPSPTQEVTVQELLQEARKRLSPEERRLAEQRADGRDWAQIAAEQGESPDVLRKRLARALARITRELGLDE